MNSQAKTVLWIGLILIAVQLVTQWQQIKAAIFTPTSSGSSAPSSGSNNKGILYPFFHPFGLAHFTPAKSRANLA